VCQCHTLTHTHTYKENHTCFWTLYASKTANHIRMAFLFFPFYLSLLSEKGLRFFLSFYLSKKKREIKLVLDQQSKNHLFLFPFSVLVSRKSLKSEYFSTETTTKTTMKDMNLSFVYFLFTLHTCKEFLPSRARCLCSLTISLEN